MKKTIEVEGKFLFTKNDLDKFTRLFQVVSTENIKDTYYDTKDYFMTKNDFWLRQREEYFELKFRVGSTENRNILSYKEITDLNDIEHHLNHLFEKQKRLKDYLEVFEPFATIETSRMKFKFKEFNIDLDSTNFGSNFGEIEILVEEEKEIEEAKKKIEHFMKEHNLKRDKIGKVLSYILKRNQKQKKILFENIQLNNLLE
eukprot:gene2935-4774_t